LQIPEEVSAVLSHPFANSPPTGCDPFWVLAHALKYFVEKNGGFLPVSNDLPDITCETAVYVKLKNMYIDTYREVKII